MSTLRATIRMWRHRLSSDKHEDSSVEAKKYVTFDVFLGIAIVGAAVYFGSAFFGIKMPSLPTAYFLNDALTQEYLDVTKEQVKREHSPAIYNCYIDSVRRLIAGSKQEGVKLTIRHARDAREMCISFQKAQQVELKI